MMSHLALVQSVSPFDGSLAVVLLIFALFGLGVGVHLAIKDYSSTAPLRRNIGQLVLNLCCGILWAGICIAALWLMNGQLSANLGFDPQLIPRTSIGVVGLGTVGVIVGAVLTAAFYDSAKQPAATPVAASK